MLPLVMSIRDSSSEEVACIELRGTTSRIVRGTAPLGMEQDIRDALTQGRWQLYAGAFHFTPYSPKDFAKKNSLADELKFRCRLNADQMRVLHGMALHDLRQLRNTLSHVPDVDARQFCINTIYSASATRCAIEQAN